MIRKILALVLLVVVTGLGAYGVYVTKDIPASRTELAVQEQARTAVVSVK